MAMIKCPECGKEISETAESCPNCGYKMQSQSQWSGETTSVGSYHASVAPKKIKKKPKWAVWVIVVIVALIVISNGGDEEEPTDSQKAVVEQENQEDNNEAENAGERKSKKEETKETEKPKKTKKPEDKFLSDLKSKLGKKVAKKTYKVLKNKIGFSSLEYKKQLGETTNYQIKADGYDVVITASDKLYRIFTPNGITWYEKGKVKNTLKQVKKRTIDSNDRNTYYIMAQAIISDSLKSPNSAKFPSIVIHPEEIAMSRKGKIITVSSYVDADNSFGASVRSDWIVQFKVLDKDSWSYNPLYINIDGVESGKYKK